MYMLYRLCRYIPFCDTDSDTDGGTDGGTDSGTDSGNMYF